MADIDDELLALAGDASSDEEDEAPTNISKAGSASPEAHTSGKTSTKKSSGRKSKRHDDSEEEGEASSGASSPNSLRSAPMDESDSESDSPAMFDEADKYPLEGRYMNAADKAEIMAMPEIKREEVLAERATEVETQRQNRALRQLLNARDAEAKKLDKKRKAGAADLDENQRKTSRQRTKLGGGKVGEASTGIDSLKRARAEKNDRQRRREEDKERNKDRRVVHEDYSDADADGDSEVEWDDGKSKNKRRSRSPEYRDAEPAGLHDIERVRVGRTRFAMVCFYPGFDEAITGCFVRISVGIDKDNGQNIYRMALIKGFGEERPYAVETANGKHFKTTQYIRAAHGKAERNWPFITCSDSPFTEAEWNRYKQTCIVEGVPLPTKPKLLQKVADINNLVNRSWTEAELQEKLTKSGALVNRFIPIERSRLTNLIKEAKNAGHTEKEELLKKELEDLDGPKLAYSTSMRPSPKKSTVSASGMSQQERLAILNKQNRRKNAEEVRQAQINERRAVKMTEAAIARGEDVAEDTSRRLKTRAKFKHDVTDTGMKKTDSERSGTNTPTSGTPKLNAKKPSTPLPHLAKLQAENNGIPTLRRPLMDDDIIGAIDLGIDLEL
ncbi:RNA polymerase-associated protein [Lachnellula hyalina]|uniref:RNA polymerase-associated protein n=1 Tax=Lachnellula hyalina TaxID=1316788 RepID=A0A8H8R740_9HELO|nr:RNA polymerase-associated protein [Lachnellula hyalina]TVY29574.1 RNA polymerase-associated protein [Lachnellula hyalina]